MGYNFINAWTPAPASPPASNAKAPINVGTSTESIQTASGVLAFDKFVAFQEMRSDSYCDSVGQNCFSPVNVSGGGINLSVINGETLSDIVVANTLCQGAGHDGVWAAMDKVGTEDVICYDSTMVQGVAQKQRFVTKYVALVWDPTFLLGQVVQRPASIVLQHMARTPSGTMALVGIFPSWVLQMHRKPQINSARIS